MLNNAKKEVILIFSWNFKTDNHDIGFSIISKDSSDQPIVPYARVNSHVEPNVGCVLCTKSGNCMLLINAILKYYKSYS